jgi:hypothetical protein
MDIGIHWSISRSFLVALVVTRCLEIFSVVPKSFEFAALQFFPHENPYGYFLTFVEDLFFSIVHVSREILRDAFRSSENPLQLIALEILPACIMVNSI